MADLLSEIAIPDLEDPLFKPFWEGMKAGELRLQHCPASGITYWPPRFRCSISGSTEFEWIAVQPEGRIYSFVTVGKSMIKGFEAPYHIALVTLDEHPEIRIVGIVEGTEPPRIDAAVAGHFIAAGEAGALSLLRWSPTT
jgi:uncharacterized OB-fold protein